MESTSLSELARARYLRLTTYRKDGTPVPTPVRVVADPGGDALLVVTGASTGKTKRLRRDPRAAVVPCDARGRVDTEALDHEVELVAAVLTDAATERLLQRRLLRKYTVQALVLRAVALVRPAMRDRVSLRLTLPG